MQLSHRPFFMNSPILMGLFGTLVLGGCGAQDPGAGQTPGDTGDSTSTGPGLKAQSDTGEWRTGTFELLDSQQVELTYHLVDGQALFEGDIKLPIDNLDYRSSGVTALGKRWPNAVVNVENTGLFNEARVTNAIAHWQARTGLRFNMGATTGNRIRFQTGSNANLCSSSLGMVGGLQTIDLGANCGTAEIIHEIGHAVGLFHEQSRTDRDNTITVITNCIQANALSQFNKFGSEGMNLGPYDISSIMQYDSFAFLDTSKAGCTATMTRKDGSTFGRTSVLDGGDIAGAGSLYLAWTIISPAKDWDKDGSDDFGLWRPSNANFYVRSTHDGGVWNLGLGNGTDIPVVGDYDNDRNGDIAVFRPSTGTWYVNFSTTHTVGSVQWGVNTDVPVPGDYDRDGATNFAVWRPLEGNWYIRRTDGSGFVVQWGLPGDIPVPADYDRDGQTDFAVFRPSNGTWFIVNSSNGTTRQQGWGVAGDVPVPADYDGDGTIDLAVWRPSTGTWFVINSSNGSTFSRQWGLLSDVPVPGKYNGTNAANLTVWRPSNGTYYVLSNDQATFRSQQFGTNGDTLVP